jgi:hypothetical protein
MVFEFLLDAAAPYLVDDRAKQASPERTLGVEPS